MSLSEWREFPSLCGGGNLMSARVHILLKSRASLTCFPACFLPVRAKDLSAPRYNTTGCLIQKIVLYEVNAECGDHVRPDDRDLKRLSDFHEIR